MFNYSLCKVVLAVAIMLPVALKYNAYRYGTCHNHIGQTFLDKSTSKREINFDVQRQRVGHLHVVFDLLHG